ncbi:MAG TPA: hypothetical protein VFB34_02290 [Chloroflexota bacterium]|nr:hypothetical protein [Chloroflexota bacterium]
MGRRRRRRRIEREHSKRPARPPRSLARRLGLLIVGLILVAGGIALLLAGGSSTRLPRVAGILIIVGLVVAVAGAAGGI